MSGADTLNYRIKQYVDGLPGKRGKDIPAPLYDRIWSVANGITQQVWGRYPTPWQMQWLFDNYHHTPDAIHKVYGEMPHPYADGLTVSEYPMYAEAYETYRKHR